MKNINNSTSPIKNYLTILLLSFIWLTPNAKASNNNIISLESSEPISNPTLITDHSTKVESNNSTFTFKKLEEKNLNLLSATAQYFISSNTDNRIGVINSLDDGSFNDSNFENRATDADGIFYDEVADVLFQLNRSSNQIDVFRNVNTNIGNGTLPEYASSSSSDFINGRELSVSGNKLVVAQDANDENNQVNQFVIYTIEGTDLILDRKLVINRNLWGIQLEKNTLYAIEDNSDRLMIFNDFFSNSPGMITEDKSIVIEDMVRTHGLVYDGDSDIMILTDVAEASSAIDGAFTIVNNFSDAIQDEVILQDEQIRISGPLSSLGNPVDVAFDFEKSQILIAERASDGGKILAYNMASTTGDMAPLYTLNYPGASAIYLAGSNTKYQLTKQADFFVSSNTIGTIAYAEVLEDNTLSIDNITSQAMDADGVFYDEDLDVLYQLNRTDNIINAYSKVKENLELGLDPELTASSTSDFINGREIAVAGNRLVVAQDANDQNGQQDKLLVYQISPTEISLKRSYDVDINLWGIHADVNTLYVIEDNSDRLVIFEDFFLNTSANISPSRSITIESMVRTHGLTYDADSDIMLLTDVAEASSSDDGAFLIIKDFSNAASDDLIDDEEQQRVSGPNSLLGNPVDIAFDADLNFVYVAERANMGGRISVYNVPEVSGDMAPVFTSLFDGASAIHLTGFVNNENPTTSTKEMENLSFDLRVFPNPSSERISVNFKNAKIDNVKHQFKILNETGQLMMTKGNGNINDDIDVSQLKPGVYYLIVHSNEEMQELKFVKI